MFSIEVIWLLFKSKATKENKNLPLPQISKFCIWSCYWTYKWNYWTLSFTKARFICNFGKHKTFKM